jgi:Neocarzinostatin family
MLSAARAREVLCLGILVPALAVAGANHALAAESVTVTPSTGLHDGQAVRVQATGYTPGKQLVVTECSGVTNASASDCAVADAQFASADSEGRIDVTVTVHAGPFGLDHIRCDVSPGCIISVTDIAFTPTELGTAPIQFVAGARSSPSESGVAPSTGFDPSVLLVVVPLLISGLWTAAMLRWVRPPATLPLVSGGVLLAGTATAQVYVLVTAAGAVSGLNAASQYAALDLAIDAVGIAVAVAAVALRRRPASGPRRRAVVCLAALVVPASLLLIIPAVSTLGDGPQSEGGGAIWYGAAACAAGAIVAALAHLSSLRAR